MFDDPNKALERMQKKLLNMDAEPDEPVEEDPEQTLDEVKEMLRREDWDEDEREPLYRSYSDGEYREEEQEPEAIPAPAKKEKKGGGTKGLIWAIIMELIGLLALFLWWLLWM